MATGDGISYNETIIKESHKHVPDTYQSIYREVYWARYVDWSLTTPLLLLDLSLLAGLSGANILVAVVADLIMILTGLFAAFGGDDGQKWGWYAIACIAYLVIVYQLAYNGRAAVEGKDSKTKAFFGAIGGFTLLLWTVYPMFVLQLSFCGKCLLSTASGVSLMAHASPTLILKLSHTPFSTSLPSRFSVSGFFSPTIA